MEGVIQPKMHVYKMQDSCLDLFQMYLRKNIYIYYSLAQRMPECVVVNLGEKKHM